MKHLIENLNIVDWVLLFAFINVFWMSTAVSIREVYRKAITSGNPKQRAREILKTSPWVLLSMLSLLIMVGILSGLPVEIASCWLLLIPGICFSVPFVIFMLLGTYSEMLWRDTFLEIEKTLRSRTKGKNG